MDCVCFTEWSADKRWTILYSLFVCWILSSIRSSPLVELAARNPSLLGLTKLFTHTLTTTIMMITLYLSYNTVLPRPTRVSKRRASPNHPSLFKSPTAVDPSWPARDSNLAIRPPSVPSPWPCTYDRWLPIMAFPSFCIPIIVPRICCRGLTVCWPPTKNFMPSTENLSLDVRSIIMITRQPQRVTCVVVARTLTLVYGLLHSAHVGSFGRAR